jgi:hypothetical protein
MDMLVDLDPNQVAVLVADREHGGRSLHVWPEEGDRQLLLRALAIAALDSPGFDFALRVIAAQLRGGPGEDGTALYDDFKRFNADRFPPGAARGNKF